MFNSKEGHTWPKSLFKPSGFSQLSAAPRASTFRVPSFLRLNSTGESSPEEETVKLPSFQKKSLLGEYFPNKEQIQRSPVKGGYNFSLAQRQYRPAKTFYRPMVQMQPYGQNSWFQGGASINHCAGAIVYPVGNFNYFYQGWPMFMQSQSNMQKGVNAATPRTEHNSRASYAATQNSVHAKSASHNDPYSKVAVLSTQSTDQQHSARRQCAESYSKVDTTLRGEMNTDVMEITSPEIQAPAAAAPNSDITVLADTLGELYISSEKHDSSEDKSQNGKTPNGACIKMYIDVRSSLDGIQGTQKGAAMHQEKVDSKSEGCANTQGCVSIGCRIDTGSSAGGSGTQISVVMENKKNLGKSSHVQGKNGYHENSKTGGSAHQPKKLSDEITSSRQKASDSGSSHSRAGSKPKGNEASCARRPNQQVLARVLLQRTPCLPAKARRPCRPSSKKRMRIKERQQYATPAKAAESRPTVNKRLKVTHQQQTDVNKNSTKKSSNNRKTSPPAASPLASTSKPCHAAIACILGISPEPKKDKPKRFWFMDSDSESDDDTDTDFSDNGDWSEQEVVSEGDMDIWNSFCKSDDPYNPLNFNSITTTTSTPKGIPKSSSAPSLLSPEVQDGRWGRGTPMFSPPKPEALARTAKKVRFAADVCMVQVYEADDWDRKGPWEQFALDAHRFQRRIRETEMSIGYVFQPQHRQKILQKIASEQV